MNEGSEFFEEAHLIERVTAGDADAFRQLYDLSYGKVARYVQKVAGDYGLADDIVAQTYTVAWQKSDTFRGNGRITTWLIGIARNIMFREFRKSKKYVPFEEEYSAAETKSQFRVEIESTNAALKAALQSLKVNHREILELVFYQDLSYGEVSELVGIPVNTVKTRVFHAKQALKDVLEKQDINNYDQ
ncbi:MAG: sigma-70 family RNA polymerase sigma factor [Desulforhopalus sp.]|nr:sigma-70 family RNA polymerase sigma factor [Desulforhopalus sp.]